MQGSAHGLRSTLHDWFVIGLVQTSDTGQIDTATVTRPITAITAGYETFRFNDSLQGIAPMFMKLEFGSGDNTPVTPAMWVTVGTGTDGAGTVTGIHDSANDCWRRQYRLRRWLCCYRLPKLFLCTQKVSWVWSLRSTGVLSRSGAFMISRFSNDDGTPNTNGFIVRTCNSNSDSNFGRRIAQLCQDSSHQQM